MQTAPQSSSRPGAFSGRARTLASDAAPEPAPAAAAAAAQVPEQAVHTITFYTNGIFTVDDGEPIAFLLLFQQQTTGWQVMTHRLDLCPGRIRTMCSATANATEGGM